MPNRTIVHAPNNQHSLLIVFDVVRATHFVNSLCCVFVMFVFVFCLVSVSLHCIFLIAHSVFCAISNFLTIRMVNILKNWMQFDHLEQDVSGNEFDFVLIVSQKGVEHSRLVSESIGIVCI